MQNAGDKEAFTITNKTKGKLPRLPFNDMKDAVLGKNFELSLVFSGHALSRKLNRIYRNKDKPTNVLSFPLSKKSGEIVIDLMQAKKEAKQNGETFRKFVGFLFIHGMLHLKGFAHGGKMESKERSIRKAFNI
jgi:probable rRNA maturation factor